jgi:hypothetical protein
MYLEQQQLILPLSLLKVIGDENYNLLGYSVSVEKIKEHYPECMEVLVDDEVEYLYTSDGQKMIRLSIHLPSSKKTYQDVTPEQYDKIIDRCI